MHSAMQVAQELRFMETNVYCAMTILSFPRCTVFKVVRQPVTNLA